MLMDSHKARRNKRAKLICTIKKKQNVKPMSKKSKLFFPNTTFIRPRVRFGAIHQTLIPAVTEEEKCALYYTTFDFARFARNEKIRRDAVVLTYTLSKEQERRLREGTNLISLLTITKMYKELFSRTDQMSLLILKGLRQQGRCRDTPSRLAAVAARSA